MTQVAAGARAVVARQAPRSVEAKRLFDDLMSYEPTIRREFIRGLSIRDLTPLLTVAQKEGGTPYCLYVDDPVGFVEDVLGESTWSKQRAVLEALNKHKRVAVPSCFGSGKCVPYSEPIQLADGSVVNAGDLVGREFHMLGWRPDGEQIVRRARAAWNRVEPVYRVQVADGRVITRNAAHPLWAARIVRKTRRTRPGGFLSSGTTPEPIGWTPTADLLPNDMAVLVPDQVHTVGDGTMPTEHAALLGYLLGDGGTTTDIRFSQMPGPALDEFMAIIGKIGARPVILPTREGRRHVEVAVRGADRTENPALDLAKQWGIFGCNAKTKRIPAALWRMAPETIATVAGRLFSCDGYVHIRTTNGRRDVYLSLEVTNEGLIRDFHRMMLRLGIRGVIRSKQGKWRGSTFTTWAWTTSTGRDIQRFAEVIDAPAKNEKITQAAEVAASKLWSVVWQTIDAPPGYHWERVVSVDRLPDEQTVAIEVDHDHAWVDLFVEHNTHIAARAALWRALVHPPGTSLTVTTATRFRQVQRLLWPHIRAAVARANLPLEADMTQLKATNADGLQVVVAYGFSAPPTDEAAWAGIHYPKLTIIVDEAGGISRIVGKAMRGLLTGDDTKLLAIGNPPTDDEGSWFEGLCETDDKATVIRISAYDAPLLSGEKTDWCRTCPKEVARHRLAIHVTDPEWVEETIEEYGADAPYVIAKVDAKFPKGGPTRAIPSDWVEMAIDRPEPEGDDYVMLSKLSSDERDDWLVQRGSWVRLGVDVAADGGDELAIARSVGDLVTIQHTSSGPTNANAIDVAGKVLVEIRKAQLLRAALGTTARVRVKVDGIGVGWGVASVLKAWRSEGVHDAEIVSVVVSEKTGRDDPKAIMRPSRKRDEMWLSAGRHLMQPRGGMPGALRLRIDRRAAAQLSAPTYGTTAAGGMTVIESKASMKARGLSSPDRAEAVLLAVYEPKVTRGGDFDLIV